MKVMARIFFTVIFLAAAVSANVYADDSAAAEALLAALQANSGAGILARANIIGTTLPVSGPLTTGPQFDELYGMLYSSANVHSLAYSEPVLFVTQSLRASTLLNALRASESAGIDALGTIVGTTIPSAGLLAPAQVVELYGLMYNGPDVINDTTLAYTDAASYVTKLLHAKALLVALRNNSGAGCVALEDIIGKIIPQSGHLTGTQPDTLFGLMYNSFSQPTSAYSAPVVYTNDLINARELLAALRDGSLAGIYALQGVTGTTLPGSGPLIKTQIEALYQLMYNGTTPTLAYTNEVLYVDGLVHAYDLLLKLRENSNAGINALVTLNLAFPTSGPLTKGQIEALYELLYGADGKTLVGYSKPLDFILYASNAAILHLALEGKREAFARMYGIPVADQTPLVKANYRAKLFDIVASSAYDKAKFLADLDDTEYLHRALELYRNDFAAIFGVAAADQVVTNDSYKQILSDIVIGKAYSQDAFISGLYKAARLHRRLNGYRNAFNSFESIAPSDQYPVANEDYREALFNVVSDPSYKEADKLGVYSIINLTLNKNTIRDDAEYILSCQYLESGASGYGAINDVAGAPTWIVPRENGMAILGLLTAASVTGVENYRTKAELAAEFLLAAQQADGSWCNQYDATTVTIADAGKSPTQTAEVMMALHKLGVRATRYNAMKNGAQYLMECQKVANKTGNDDGLICGGKNASGVYEPNRWVSDNSYAYQALKAAALWARANEDHSFAIQCADAAERIIQGINTYFYISDSAHADYGVWRRVIDNAGNQVDAELHDWINYAPQMLDLPAQGVGQKIVGEWIHNKFQQADGSVVIDDGAQSDRKAPGLTFQACLVWTDLGMDDYVHQAMDWAQSSGLWDSTNRGWIDWKTTAGVTAETWERFIDTSFYAISVMHGGYDFNSESSPAPVRLTVTHLSDSAAGDLLVNFGSDFGLYVRHQTDNSWSRLQAAPAAFIANANIDAHTGMINDLVVDFGTGYGIWAYGDSQEWTALHSINAKTFGIGDFDNDGKDDVVIDFGFRYGIWIHYATGTWVQLHPFTAESISAADLDGNGCKDIVINFGTKYGVWAYMNNTTWTQIYGLAPFAVAGGDLDADGSDDLVMDFGDAYGIWARFASGGWTHIHSMGAKSIIVSDLDSDGAKDIVVDFGAVYGIWVRYATGNWTQLHGATADAIAAGDLDGNGSDDLVIDFGSESGIWARFDNGSWSQLYSVS